MNQMGTVLLLLYILGINIVTYLAFWIDKERARAGRYRIAERTLLLLALLGGSPAGLLAQRRLRHKTRKQPFAGLLAGIALLQAVAVAGFAVKAL
jgi:uncharacterized membrane protein YsdA (DUF1294 family)